MDRIPDDKVEQVLAVVARTYGLASINELLACDSEWQGDKRALARQAVAYLLSVDHGKSYQRIARILGCRVTTIIADMMFASLHYDNKVNDFHLRVANLREQLA